MEDRQIKNQALYWKKEIHYDNFNPNVKTTG